MGLSWGFLAGSPSPKELMPRWGQAVKLGGVFTPPGQKQLEGAGKCWVRLGKTWDSGGVPARGAGSAFKVLSSPNHSRIPGQYSMVLSVLGGPDVARQGQRKDFPRSQRGGNSWNILSMAPSPALLSRTAQQGPQRAHSFPGKLRQGGLAQDKPHFEVFFCLFGFSRSPKLPVPSSSDSNKHSLSGQSHSTRLENWIFPFFSQFPLFILFTFEP